ncbi:MAG: hypothetical protein AAB505_01090, partial [Patescibacteria group bacterium]
IAQRLVPLLCQDSKEPMPVEGGVKMMVEKELASIPSPWREKVVVPKTVYRAKRSATCPSGTRGRIAVFEVLKMSSELEQVILADPSETKIEQVARSGGLLTMREDCLLKSFAGEVPFEEVSKL